MCALLDGMSHSPEADWSVDVQSQGRLAPQNTQWGVSRLADLGGLRSGGCAAIGAKHPTQTRRGGCGQSLQATLSSLCKRWLCATDVWRLALGLGWIKSACLALIEAIERYSVRCESSCISARGRRRITLGDPQLRHHQDALFEFHASVMAQLKERIVPTHGPVVPYHTLFVHNWSPRQVMLGSHWAMHVGRSRGGLGEVNAAIQRSADDSPIGRRPFRAESRSING